MIYIMENEIKIDNNTHNNIAKKIELINALLKDVNLRTSKYYKRYKKYRRINKICKGFITGLNALSVSSIILMLNPIIPAFMFIALISTSISGIMQAILQSIEIDVIIQNDHTSFLQYSDLYRSTNNVLIRNNLRSVDYDNLLVIINDKLGLIEDASNLI